MPVQYLCVQSYCPTSPPDCDPCQKLQDKAWGLPGQHEGPCELHISSDEEASPSSFQMHIVWCSTRCTHIFRGFLCSLSCDAALPKGRCWAAVSVSSLFPTRLNILLQCLEFPMSLYTVWRLPVTLLMCPGAVVSHQLITKGQSGFGESALVYASG